MTEKQYKELCQICDKILLLPDSTIERVAIPWLHVIREHPIFLKNYDYVFKIKNFFIFKISLLIRSIYYYFLWLIFSINRNNNLKKWYSTKKEPDEVDILFVSHILNKSNFGKNDDFYFANTPSKIQEEGKKVAIVCLNHTNIDSKKLSLEWNENSLERIILTNSIIYSEEVEIRNRLVRESERLKNSEKGKINSNSRKIFLQASVEALSPSSQKNLRLQSQIENIVTLYNPKVLVVTFEGHAWERVAFAAARTVNKNIKCVGFHHSAIFKHQHSIRRRLNKNYDPNYILTAGEIGKSLLIKNNNFYNIQFEILGSNRGFHNNYNNKEKKIINSCLVLPEGYISECNLLFGFSLECAKQNPSISFIWRLHPSVSFDKLLMQNKLFKRLPNNIILSDMSLEKDIERTSLALYRGSTAILQAIGSGLLPIYLKLEEEMSINPLYEIETSVPMVLTPSDFHKQTTKVKKGMHLFEMNKIFDYSKKFYYPFDHHKLLDIL